MINTKYEIFTSIEVTGKKTNSLMTSHREKACPMRCRIRDTSRKVCFRSDIKNSAIRKLYYKRQMAHTLKIPNLVCTRFSLYGPSSLECIPDWRILKRRRVVETITGVTELQDIILNENFFVVDTHLMLSS